MNIRLAEKNDLKFLKEMLYQAVYWRSMDKAPTLEEAVVKPGVLEALEDFFNRSGDIGVIGEIDGVNVGAAWYRYYNDENAIRGYISDDVPALVIATHPDYRGRGIAYQLIEELHSILKNKGVKKVSLCVTKDNVALGLYKKAGFKEFEDLDDSINMVKIL